MKLTIAALSLLVPLVTCGAEGPPAPPMPEPMLPAEEMPGAPPPSDSATVPGDASGAPAVGAPSP